MLIKVTNYFYDKDNPEKVFLEGDVVKVEDEARAKDILDRKLGVEVKTEPEEFKVLGEERKATDEETKVENMTKDQLMQALDQMGKEYPKAATKAELIALFEK